MDAQASYAENLNTMSADAFQKLVESMDFEDAKAVCQTNSRLNGICVQRKLLEPKARQIVTTEAPLGESITSIIDYATLIRRGFKTVYRIDSEHNCSFGAAIKDVNSLEFAFEIVGLPPPTGTEVWVLGEAEDAKYTPAVFSSLEDLEADIIRKIDNFSGGYTIISRFVEFYGGTAPRDEQKDALMEALNELIEQIEMDGFFCIRTILP